MKTPDLGDVIEIREQNEAVTVCLVTDMSIGFQFLRDGLTGRKQPRIIMVPVIMLEQVEPGCWVLN